MSVDLFQIILSLKFLYHCTLLNSSVLLNWKSAEHNKAVNLKYVVDVMCHSHNSLLADSQKPLLAKPFPGISWGILSSPHHYILQVELSCKRSRGGEMGPSPLNPPQRFTFPPTPAWTSVPGPGFALFQIVPIGFSHCPTCNAYFMLFDYGLSSSKSFGVFDCACELKSPPRF